MRVDTGAQPTRGLPGARLRRATIGECVAEPRPKRAPEVPCPGRRYTVRLQRGNESTIERQALVPSAAIPDDAQNDRPRHPPLDSDAAARFATSQPYPGAGARPGG